MSLLIRIAGVEDVPAIVAIYASHVLTSAATFEMEPPDADEVDRRMHTVIEGGFLTLSLRSMEWWRGMRMLHRFARARLTDLRWKTLCMYGPSMPGVEWDGNC